MSGFIIGLTGGVASGKSELTRRFEALGVYVADADVAARQVVEPGQPALAAIVTRFGPGMLQADGSLDRRQLRERIFADPSARRALEAITHPAIRATLEAQCRAAPGPYAIAAIPLLAEAGVRRSDTGTGVAQAGTGAADALSDGAGVAGVAGVAGDARDAGVAGDAKVTGVTGVTWVTGVTGVAGTGSVGPPAGILAGVRAVYPWLDRILVVDTPETVQHARLMRRDGVDEALASRMIAAQVSRATRLAIADDVVVNDGAPDHLDARVADLDALYRQLAL